MGEIVVHLATAMICYLNQCHPALVGPSTPQGTFPVKWEQVSNPGYGGDILEFARDDKNAIFAIHRVWLLSPKQRRWYRLTEGTVAERRDITGGCINVTPEVYKELVDCCSRGTVVIMN